MKALVVGGMGFIGSNLVDQLINDGHSVIVLDNLSSGKIENGNKKAKFWRLDITTPRDIFNSNLFEGVDWVFHVAAKTNVQESIEDPFAYNNTNVTGLLNILSLSNAAGVSKFIFSSSSAVYGDVVYTPTDESHITDPISPYGVSKLIGENYCRNFYRTYGLETTCLRYFNVYGDRQHSEGTYAPVIGKFMEQKNKGLPMTIYGDGEQRRDFVHVNDVVRANILAATSSYDTDFRNNFINIGSGINYSVNEIANMVGDEQVNVDPVLEPRESLADISKAKELLGWVPKYELKEWLNGHAF